MIIGGKEYNHVVIYREGDENGAVTFSADVGTKRVSGQLLAMIDDKNVTEQDGVGVVFFEHENETG